jgi:poly-gamma-glutamate capsule biosynthesis protein CapA/YwtB (metallophosphatase superfamily)
MMAVATLALAGDTMLGRGVAQRLATAPFRTVFAPALRELTAEADAFVLNLECCVSDRGAPWAAPGKRFFFRAPPRAADALAWLGVDCVTLANNHALDYGPVALQDTRRHLANAGIDVVGAGAEVDQAREWRMLTVGDLRLGVLGVTDHPPDYAAGPARPGVAYADLVSGVPGWLRQHITAMVQGTEVCLVTPHWGPNMAGRPVRHVRAAAAALVDAGASLVAGHSAHICQGVAGRVLYDLGDFIDDYATHPGLRNDLGLLFLVTLDAQGPIKLEAVPLALDFCRTRLADTAESAWLKDRFTAACAEWGTEVSAADDGRLVVRLR